jgi:competence protein ComEA
MFMPEDVPFELPPRPAPAGSAFVERLHEWRRDPRVAVVLLLLCAVGAGVFWFRSGIAESAGSAARADGAAVPTTAAANASTTTTTTASSAVVVHVAGAVAKPGVVTLVNGGRVVDAIEAAGGAAPDADLDRLNLAAPLADGERVAVAVRGQPAPPLDANAPANADAGASSSAADGPVNLNTATLDQLEALPGIGPTLAQAIIDERERSGGFRAVEDLRRVRGIGDARFAQVQALVTV